MSNCSGNNEGHCCHFFSGVCQFLEENTVPGRRWACSLLRKYGSWEEMYLSEEWKIVIADAIASGLGEDYRCGSWPPPGHKCGECGVIG